jgi:beta-glucosidase
VPWADSVGAIVEAWYGGQRGGEAIARVLTGEVNPSGRLPVTWPRAESQLPRPTIPGTGAAPDAPVTVDYRIEGSDVGYRWFARQRLSPQYWFGHGLSYTSFDYSRLQVDGGDNIVASVTVTNTGRTAGKDVVQLYLTGTPTSSERRLLAFEKVELQPGKSKSVTLTADPRLLAEYDVVERGWSIAPGTYNVAIGTDAATMKLSDEAKLDARTWRP